MTTVKTVKTIKHIKPIIKGDTYEFKGYDDTPITNLNEFIGKSFSSLDVENEYFIIKTRDRLDKFEFSVDQATTCCGVWEFGGLKFTESFPMDTAIKILKNAVKYLVKTSVIYTNGIDDSVRFEEALSKCKNWVSVKRFKNPGSGNLITMWVSNNE